MAKYTPDGKKISWFPTWEERKKARNYILLTYLFWFVVFFAACPEAASLI